MQRQAGRPINSNEKTSGFFADRSIDRSIGHQQYCSRRKRSSSSSIFLLDPTTAGHPLSCVCWPLCCLPPTTEEEEPSSTRIFRAAVVPPLTAANGVLAGRGPSCVASLHHLQNKQTTMIGYHRKCRVRGAEYVRTVLLPQRTAPQRRLTPQ